jgi:DNA-binding Lrp family transcriptional regulator
MDEIDRQIVAQLRTNARASFQSIGSRVSLSAPAVKRRVDRLEADGVIRSYAAVVDPGAMGWRTHALVSLFCEGRMAAAEVRSAVADHPEVAAAYTVAGGERDPARARATRSTWRRRWSASADTPGIIRTQTQVVLSTLFERPVAG